MPKKTDIEQRLQALEDRQNMFMGGFTMPTTMLDGGTPPLGSRRLPLPPAPVNPVNVTEIPERISGG